VRGTPLSSFQELVVRTAHGPAKAHRGGKCRTNRFSCSRRFRNFTGTYTVLIRGWESERSMTKDLQELVDRTRKIEMTPDQLRKQRRSFAYGNTHIENDRITREMVADLDARLEAEHK
jgi:hypothetical protein